MGEYNVKDPQALLEQAGNLDQLGQNILRVNEDLTNYCQQIGSAWQSDTADKESYLSVLEENLRKIETLCSALRGLSYNLTYYAQQTIQTQQN